MKKNDNIEALKKIFSAQEEFQRLLSEHKKLNVKFLLDRNKVQATKDMVLYLEEEAHELLRLLKWKEHKLEQNVNEHPDYVIQAIKEEIIDVQHFVLNLALIWGFTPEEFYKEFFRKNNINKARLLKL